MSMIIILYLQNYRYYNEKCPDAACILSSTSFQMGKTYRGVGSAAVEQSRRKANMVARGNRKFSP